MGSNAAPEKSLQKNLSRKIARFLVSKISPATGVRWGLVFFKSRLQKDVRRSGRVLAGLFSQQILLNLIKRCSNQHAEIFMDETNMRRFESVLISHVEVALFRERTHYRSKFGENDSFRKLFLFFKNTFQYLGEISKEISGSHFDSRRSLSSANRRQIVGYLPGRFVLSALLSITG